MVKAVDYKRTCMHCGKSFVPPIPEEWAYRRTMYGRNAWFCSWGCLRGAEKAGRLNYAPQKKTPDRPTTAMICKGNLLWAIDRSGRSRAQLSLQMGFDRNYITHVLNRQLPRISRKNLRILAEGLGVEESFLEDMR